MSTYWENWGIGTTQDDHTGAILRTGGVSLQRQLKELYGGRSTQPDSTNGHLTGRYCDPRDWTGWDPTGVNGISTILSSAISQSITDNVQLQIPPGLYSLDTPVDVTPSQFDGLDMVAMTAPTGGGYTFSLSRHGCDVYFQSLDPNKPAFYNSRAIRSAHFANFTVLGPNMGFSSTQAPNDFKQNYNPNGAYRDTQFSPQAGFAVDAFNVAVPADGGYPGMTSIYAGSTVNGSSGIQMENVCIFGFVVCITLACNGQTTIQSCDTLKFWNCFVGYCDTGVAIGQTQSKDAYWYLGGIGSCRTCFDGANYGAGQGYPIQSMEMNFGYVHRLVDYNASGPLYIINPYMESVRSIGNYGLGGSSARGQCSIQNMKFTLDTSPALPPAIIFETYGLASIRDSTFGAAGNFPMRAWNLANDMSTPIQVDTCGFGQSGTSLVPAVVGATLTGPNVALVNAFSNGSFPYQPMSDDSVADVSTFASNNYFVGTANSRFYGNGTGVVQFVPPTSTSVANIAATGTVINSRAVTFTTTLASGAISATLSGGNWTDVTGWYMTTFSNADVRPARYVNGSTAVAWGSWGLSSTATASASALGVSLSFTATDVTLIQLNDLFFWQQVKRRSTFTARTVLCWVVTNITGSVVTCQPISDVTTFDTVANNGGGTTLHMYQFPWAPTTPLTCTTDGTTAVITLVSPITILHNGNWVQGSGIPAGARVVSGGGTATVTLNKNTTAAGVATPLFFGRFNTPTINPTW